MSASAATMSIGAAARRAGQFGAGTVQVADDPLGVRPAGEPAQVGVPGGVQRGHPGRASAGPRRRARTSGSPASSSMGPSSSKTGPWPGTMVRAPSGRTTCSSTSMAPATEPMSRNGVPPLKIRSPQNSTERSGIQTIESLVVCAAVPDVADVRPQVADVHGDLVGEGDERRVEASGRPSRGRPRTAGRAAARSAMASCPRALVATMAAPPGTGSCRRCDRRGDAC